LRSEKLLSILTTVPSKSFCPDAYPDVCHDVFSEDFTDAITDVFADVAIGKLSDLRGSNAIKYDQLNCRASGTTIAKP